SSDLVPAHDAAGQRGVRAARPQGARRRGPRARRAGAGAGRPLARRRPQARRALRRAAAAGGAGPSGGDPPVGAAAGRAAVQPGRAAARADAPRAAAGAAGDRADRDPGHPRPGRGAGALRHHGHPQRRPAGAAGRAAGRLPPPGQQVRRRVPRLRQLPRAARARPGHHPPRARAAAARRRARGRRRHRPGRHRLRGHLPGRWLFGGGGHRRRRRARCRGALPAPRRRPAPRRPGADRAAPPPPGGAARRGAAVSRAGRGAAVLAGAVALAAAASSCAAVREDDPDTLVVSTFAFATEEFMEVVGEPFEEETGIEVVLDTGTNAGRLTKLRINKEAPDTDVVLISDYYARIGADMGLFAEVDPADVPAMEGIWPWAVDPQGYGPAYTFQLLGMVYRTDLVDGVPDSWDDLGSGGDYALPDISVSAGPMLVLAAGEHFGSGPADPDAGFEALAGLGPGALQFYTG